MPTLSPTRVDHPLALATADEIAEIRSVLDDEGLLTRDTRFVYVGLEEPSKADLYTEAPAVDRRFRILLHNATSPDARDVVVSVTTRTVLTSVTLDAVRDGQMPVLDEEFELVETVLATDPQWLEALARRGLDVADVRVAPLSAGVFDYPGEEGRRILRGLAFRQDHPKDHAWAHPIDGLVAFVDVMNRTVDKVVDMGVVPIPEESGNFDDPAVTGPLRTTQKPIEITQPDGPSFTVDGNLVDWEKWSFRVGFDAREGLVLHQIGFSDAGVVRPIIHRASIAEMVVPYGDPSPVRSWQNYFDTGEYLVGRYANSLELGCDCVGDITYFDAVIADELGNPKTLTNAVCMHEEDFGVLWKHTDIWTGSQETRRQRRLVISFFTTIGNYDYGFFWYLYLDGTIEFEVKATGIVFTSGHPGGDYPYASEIAPGLGAPCHQHLFSARLDMMLDGATNSVEEIDTRRVQMGPNNLHGNAFALQRTPLTSESDGQRVADNAVGRIWHVSNPHSLNRLGKPVGYSLHPEGQPLLLAADDSSIATRAAFATKHLWVTRFDEKERYAAGDFVNQNHGGGGLPAFVAGNRSIDDEDIVLWHTFGLTHFPRPEDWPIMPVDYTGFKLKPVGFFDRNPTLDVPRTASSHCATGGASCHDGGRTDV
ncbi:primary-amine oxidase [Rhodococcus sp. BP-252]|uniref:primary-amine oxidase n=1 Tax=unclassified Rhodococcus (in: high G+C Gram-positive bacteria) TaxID=192944 RepID=UPI001C9AEB0D|nr:MULTISPECIES: primary-amine oxidase [unclassified Rhodococcus (in: high G+C Gram-positive bacteria)]MBY6412846.1 primary-amine oxidase [Rhodococcus sp. BP-320]MBY6417617.1 primary-amine oxidase [Rhodococcus sp. BP-321]MBY6423469.1 primary-amine oxidase [Rhodococcus sp. BP-324]MBY6427641.1 primary-amine oxidase [Rhodococcus sp. BP-323]MBY6432805.1 primary-amine oxidase [Rhodococcus sp. BP-322]